MKNLTSSFESQQFISIPYQQILAAPNNTVWEFICMQLITRFEQIVFIVEM